MKSERRSLYADIDDAKAIVRGGNPNNPKARTFLWETLDAAFRRLIEAESIALSLRYSRSHEQHAHAKARRLANALRPEPKRRRPSSRRESR